MTTTKHTPLEREMLLALMEAENTLLDYIDTIEKRGASLYYGRSVLARIRAVIAAYESRSQSGVTEQKLNEILRRNEVSFPVMPNTDDLVSGKAARNALREATDTTLPVSEEYLRELRAEVDYEDRPTDYQIGFDKAVNLMRRVSQPPADGRDDGWRPIETAPKDGTVIFLAPRIDGRIAAVGHWADYFGGCWYDLNIGNLNGLWKPTSWMPMPALKSPPNTTGTVLAGAGGLK